MTEYPENEPMTSSDHAVLADLARLVSAADPVPDGLVERSLFALTLEGLHAELMELRRVETPALALRGESDWTGTASVETRTITFSTDSVTVLISLSAGPGGGVRIDGWSAPATTFVVELYRPDGCVGTRSDADGRFSLPDVAPGPASLVLRRLDGEGHAVSTPVIDL
ncbi:hypothetical protein [Cellulomonas sp. KRMCY2]|uniref:hypothetical protein n=1 Tax=Cellulomonas sp. KRMCY2 TaxID=1304865 RepID=UPI00045E7A92|nr:hypothetical protein [Cellulomonas sp. KRMCY2]